jgi:hypothetical protein
MSRSLAHEDVKIALASKQVELQVRQSIIHRVREPAAGDGEEAGDGDHGRVLRREPIKIVRRARLR